MQQATKFSGQTSKAHGQGAYLKLIVALVEIHGELPLDDLKDLIGKVFKFNSADLAPYRTQAVPQWKQKVSNLITSNRVFDKKPLYGLVYDDSREVLRLRNRDETSPL